MLKIKSFFFVLLLSGFFVSCSTFRQVPIPGELNGWNGELPPPLISDPEEKSHMIQKTIYHLEQNNFIYWGLLSEDERADYLALYEEISHDLENTCVSFINLDLDWTAVKQDVKNKILSAESHGEALGALTRLTYYLKEGHTMMIPERLVMDNNLVSGAPCISVNSFNINPLGAWVTPCKDDSLVISKVFDPSSPYSWKVGDEIVAVNGIPWLEWREALEKSSLPILGSAGANPEAVEMNWRKSVIRNLHLFTTVSILRKESGIVDVVRIPDKEFTIQDTYQEAPFPIEFSSGSEIGRDYEALEGGIISGTNIGYIKIHYFDQEVTRLETWDPAETFFYKEFRSAIESLWDTDGMILDLRNHGGGLHHVSYGGLELLVANPEDQQFYDVFEKTGPTSFEPYPLLEHQFHSEVSDTHYGKKIFVLTGSECVSGGDIFTAISSESPEITVLGTAHNGSFAGHMNDKVYQEGKIRIFTMIPHLIWFRQGTEISDLRKSFVEEIMEYEAEDIASGTDTLLNAAMDQINQ